MLYHISSYLEMIWGPFRLLRSHATLLAIGTFLAAITVLVLLPKLWHKLPSDQGKAILGKDGMVSKGKPTGAGFFITLLILPVILLFVPLSIPFLGVIFFLYISMLFGYLDDRAKIAWGQLKKGLLDTIVSAGVASCIYLSIAQGTGVYETITLWFPLSKEAWLVPWYYYIPIATFILWVSLNSTNCSDGVDGLAGSLSAVSLASLAIFLYLVIGNMPAAKYLLIPIGGTAARIAARWARFLTIVAGGVAGYLWWNAEPSKVLMGDAGSRFLGLLVGAGVLATGNPVLILAFAPVVLINGGMGLVKLILLRVLKKMGFDTRPTNDLPEEDAKKQSPLVKALFKIRFPLHDHCKRNLKWSNAQVLMRFMLLQIFLVPLIFFILIKIR